MEVSWPSTDNPTSLSMNKELFQTSDAWDQCQESLLLLMSSLSCRMAVQGEEEEGCLVAAEHQEQGSAQLPVPAAPC